MTEKARNLGEQPAYPVVIPEVRGGDGQVIQQCVQDGGMTIHQQFAMTAMQGRLASFITTADPDKAQVSIFATEMADAMLEALAARDL